MRLSRLFRGRKAPYEFNEAKCVQAPPGIGAQAIMIGQSCAIARDGLHVESRAKLAAGGFERNRIKPKAPGIGQPT